MPDGTKPGVSLKNNSPGVNHKQSIDIIDSLTLSNENIKLKFLIK